MATAMVQEAAAGGDYDSVFAKGEEVLAAAFYCSFLNATSVRRMSAHGRIPASIGEQLAGVPDDAFCLTLGTIGGVHPCPTDAPGRAGTLKNPALVGNPVCNEHPMGAVVGANADTKAERAVLEAALGKLEEGCCFANVHVSNVGRQDRANEFKAMVEEVWSGKVEGEVELGQNILCHGIVAAWGSSFLSYWIKKN
jgi:hypothetical protein